MRNPNPFFVCLIGIVVIFALMLIGIDCTPVQQGGSLPGMPKEVVDQLEPGTIIGGISMTDEEAWIMAYNNGWEGWLPANPDTSWYEWMDYLPAKHDRTSGGGMWMCEERSRGAWPTPSGCANFYILWSVEGADTTGHLLMIRLQDNKAVPIWMPHIARAYGGP